MGIGSNVQCGSLSKNVSLIYKTETDRKKPLHASTTRTKCHPNNRAAILTSPHPHITRAQSSHLPWTNPRHRTLRDDTVWRESTFNTTEYVASRDKGANKGQASGHERWGASCVCVCGLLCFFRCQRGVSHFSALSQFCGFSLHAQIFPLSLLALQPPPQQHRTDNMSTPLLSIPSAKGTSKPPLSTTPRSSTPDNNPMSTPKTGIPTTTPGGTGGNVIQKPSDSIILEEEIVSAVTRDKTRQQTDSRQTADSRTAHDLCHAERARERRQDGGIMFTGRQP